MIAVVDYGLGNLRSVSKALERVGAKVLVTDDAAVISRARGIVLPGVGAFSVGMRNLRQRDLLGPLTDFISSGRPFLGICLGMQLLLSESEEHGITPGLGVVPGLVKRFPAQVKIPHMGWNELFLTGPGCRESAAGGSLSPGLFSTLDKGAYFYFVHSYYVIPGDGDVVVATAHYGIDFAAALNRGNVWGIQFHPEKSARTGLRFLSNFAALVDRSGER